MCILPTGRSFLILGDPGAVSRVDKMFVVKVYYKIETSPWALTLTEPVPEAFELPASDWPEKIFSGQSEAGNWNWFGKSKCPGARLDLIVNFHHEHFIDPTNCPWVSEDGPSS